MPGSSSCASCHARVAGAAHEDEDDFDPFDPMVGAELPVLDAEIIAPPPKPTPKAVEAPSPQVQAARLRQLAGYGLPPDSFLASVPYAASVWFKRRELKARLAEVTARERVLSRALDKRRRELATALFSEDEAAAIPSLSPLLSPARSVHDRESERADEEQARAQSAAAARGAAQEAIDSAARDVMPLRDEETRTSRALEAAKGELARSQAALRRAEIELRNAAQTGTLDAEGQASLEATRESRQAEVNLLAGRVKERSQALGAARRELAARVGRQAAAEEEARRMASPSNSTLRMQTSTELDPALVALTDAALTAELGALAAGPVSVCKDARDALTSARNEQRLLRDAEKSFEPEAFRRGAAILGAGVLLITIAMLVAILR